MRKIKFRAWDDKGKKWLLGYDHGTLGGFHIDGECVYLREWEKVLDDAFHDRIDLKIMQFTGQNDKNGTEIYEGDVVLVHLETLRVKKTVSYDHQTASFVAGDLWFKDGGTDIEIIGNIYENPELIQSVV
jgi:uncharacterized phage protein (TIGR01671 family)